MGTEMILDDFILPSRVGQTFQYSGIDHPKECRNPEHFKKYPYTVIYRHNSRGFRDLEWPDSIQQLKQAIWCVGDSFMVGLGAPWEHTLPYLLACATGQRVINVSLDGASNDWISRKVQRIQNDISPKNIVICWSYLHREESENASLDDEQRRIWVSSADHIQNLENFKKNLQKVLEGSPAPIQFLIPDAFYRPENPDVTSIFDEGAKQTEHVISVNQITEIKKLDLARDGHHFDRLTSQWIVDRILPKLNP